MKTIILGTALATAALALCAGGATAREPVHSGSWTAQITKQEAQPLGSQDHVLVAQVAHGTNKSTGSKPLADDAQVIFSETVDLDKGNGPQHGQFSIVDSKGSVTSEYKGKITTTMVDGKPRTTGQGTYRDVGGSGAYKGADATGTYSFTMTSPTDVVGEWKESMATAKR